MHVADPITFGIALPQEGVEFAVLREHAQAAERLGYDSVWLVDHLVPNFSRAAEHPECWTTMTALAAYTTSIRIGTMVLCNSFRHPPLLANMAATLDRISNGRLEFAIGSGWIEREYRAYGYEFPPAAIRMAQLEEALVIFKKMWTEECPSFVGRYFAVNGPIGCPRPVQKPHPPIWIGGKGERLLLRLVARYADYWNAPGLAPEEFAHKTRVLEQHCADVGRNAAEVKRSWWGQLYIDEDVERLRRRLTARLPSLARSPYTSHLIAGTPEECVAEIKRFVSLGVTRFSFIFGQVNDLRSTQLFAAKVIPAFHCLQ